MTAAAFIEAADSSTQINPFQACIPAEIKVRHHVRMCMLHSALRRIVLLQRCIARCRSGRASRRSSGLHRASQAALLA